MQTPQEVLYNDPTAYERAFSTVMGRHQEEVMQSKLKDLVDAEVQKQVAEKLKDIKPDKKRISFTESGGVPGGEKSKKTGRITPKEAEMAKQMNISNQDFFTWKQRQKGGNV